MNWLTCTRLACGISLMAAVTAAPAQSQEVALQDWAGFRGPNLDLTVSDPSGIESGGSYRLEVVWRKHLGDGYSAISISDGIAVSAFADAENNYVGAFNADSGAPMWRVRTGPMFPGRFGSISGPIATPLVAARRVFTLDNLGILFALDLDSGEELWRSHFVDDLGAEIPFYGYTSSPLLYEDSVIVQTGAADGALTRFDASTGSVMWSSGTAVTTHQAASLVEVQGQTQVVLVGDENLVGIEPETGAVLWDAPHGGEGIFKGTATTHLVPINSDSVLTKTDSHSTPRASRHPGRAATGTLANQRPTQ